MVRFNSTQGYMITEEGIFCDYCKKKVCSATTVYENSTKLDLCIDCEGEFASRYFIEKAHERMSGVKSKLAMFCHEHPVDEFYQAE